MLEQQCDGTRRIARSIRGHVRLGDVVAALRAKRGAPRHECADCLIVLRDAGQRSDVAQDLAERAIKTHEALDAHWRRDRRRCSRGRRIDAAAAARGSRVSLGLLVFSLRRTRSRGALTRGRAPRGRTRLGAACSRVARSALASARGARGE